MRLSNSEDMAFASTTTSNVKPIAHRPTRSLFTDINNLPIELQLIIYDYALTVDYVITFDMLKALASKDKSKYTCCTSIPSLLLAGTSLLTRFYGVFLRLNPISLRALRSASEKLRGYWSAELQGSTDKGYRAATMATDGGMACAGHIVITCRGVQCTSIQLYVLDDLERCDNVRKVTILHCDSLWNPSPYSKQTNMTLELVRKLVQGQHIKQIVIKGHDSTSNQAQSFHAEVQRYTAAIRSDVDVKLTCEPWDYVAVENGSPLLKLP